MRGAWCPLLQGAVEHCFTLMEAAAFSKNMITFFYQTTPYHHIPENSDLHTWEPQISKNILVTLLFEHWKHTQMKHETNFSEMCIWCLLIVSINTTKNSFSNWNFINIYFTDFQYKSLRVIWWKGSYEQT